MRVRLGTIAFTSRMIFGFEPASKDSSLTLKTVFSFGFSYTRDDDLAAPLLVIIERTSTAASSCGAAAGAAAVGIAISWMLRRV